MSLKRRVLHFAQKQETMKRMGFYIEMLEEENDGLHIQDIIRGG